MSEWRCFLLTILHGEQLLRVALRVHADEVQGDVMEYYMEPENREAIRELLPPYISDLGNVIEVEPIYEVVTREVK